MTSKAPPPLRAALRSALRLYRLAGPPPAAAGALLGLTALEALIPLATPWILGFTIDQVVLGHRAPELPRARLAACLMLLLAVESAGFAAGFARAWWTRRAVERSLRELRRRLHDRLLALPAAFHDRHPRGALSARLLEDTDQVDGLVSLAVGSVGLSPLMCAGAFAAMAWFYPPLAAVALLPVPLVAWVAWRGALGFRRDYPPTRDASAALHVHAEQVLDAIRPVQLYRAEPAMRGRFAARQEALVAARLALARRSALFFPLLGLAGFAGTLLALAVGGPAAIGGRVTVGTLVASVATLGVFYAPLLDIARAWTIVQRLGACADRLFEVLDAVPAIADRADARPLPDARGAVALEGVTFAYPGAAVPALRDVTLRVAPGDIAAVAGPSGSGKSTLLKLLPRLYDPDAGAVRLDGTDARELRLDDLRRHVALVPQEDALPGDTVREALTLGAAGLDDAAIARALRTARAEDFVAALSGGLDAPLQEGGANFSAGQRQRLALARALLRDPAVLVLDEATSAVDPVVEEAIWKGLFADARRRTLIAAAHRPATLLRFPRVIVIEDGRVTGDGPPAALRESHAFLRRVLL